MEQRIYHGPVTPQDLADHLIAHFDPLENLQAQVVGKDGAIIVQIGRGDVPADLRHAVTVAIASDRTIDGGVIVTLGQQQWLTPQMAGFAAVMGLVAVMITPWALFALLWPVSEAVGSSTLPADVWGAIDLFVAGHGGSLEHTEQLEHPHAAPAR